MLHLLGKQLRAGAWGFIIRDNDGEVVLAAAGRLDAVHDVLMAEAVACLKLKELKAASDHGVSHVQIEMDSSHLRETISSSSFDLSTSGILFREIRDLVHEQFVCSDVLLVPRSCNLLAHGRTLSLIF